MYLLTTKNAPTTPGGNTMATRTYLKPSDVVVWKQSRDGRTWTLKPHGPVGRELDDRTPTNPQAVRFDRIVCKITTELTELEQIERELNLTEYERHVGDGARIWTLTTAGPHRGSTRHREMLTFVEAQRAALAWLDRRFAVPGPYGRPA